jgi:DNA-binding transcriptional MerR regulator
LDLAEWREEIDWLRSRGVALKIADEANVKMRAEVENQTNRAEATEAELAEIKSQQAAEHAEMEAGMEAWHQQPTNAKTSSGAPSRPA